MINIFYSDYIRWRKTIIFHKLFTLYLNICFLARLQRHLMVDKDLEEIRDKVPGLKKGSSQLFRTLRDKGIISYTEYLFLLSVLTSK